MASGASERVNGVDSREGAHVVGKVGRAMTLLDSGMGDDVSDVFLSGSDTVEKSFGSSVFPSDRSFMINDVKSHAPRAVPLHLNRILCISRLSCFSAETKAYVIRKPNIPGSLCRLEDRKPAAIYSRSTKEVQKICCVTSPPFLFQ